MSTRTLAIIALISGIAFIYYGLRKKNNYVKKPPYVATETMNAKGRIFQRPSVSKAWTQLKPTWLAHAEAAPAPSPGSICKSRVAERYDLVMYFCKRLNPSSSDQDWLRCSTFASGFMSDYPETSCHHTETQQVISDAEVARELDEAAFHLGG